MNYVLDTNVVSEALKDVPDRICAGWLEEHIDECFLTAVTLAELNYGADRLPEGKRKQDFRRKINFLWEDFSDQILDFDAVAAGEFGRYVAEFEATRGLQAVENADVRDFQIAAIARAHGCTVASRNLKHFANVTCINPFTL